jgi:magnesium transporter
MLSFFPIGYAKLCSETMPADLPSLTHDIKVMIDHGEYLTQKIEFQLETTLGLINLEQTYIIKTFTVLAMIFMPPTLIASIYGMNFKNIPELSLPYAYPLCLLLMLATSIIPYKIFKSKGWI